MVAEELMVDLNKEVARIRADASHVPEAPDVEELIHELDEMRRANKALRDQNEELQATIMSRGVEEGRSLLNGTTNNLANELGEMSERQVSSIDAQILPPFWIIISPFLL